MNDYVADFEQMPPASTEAPRVVRAPKWGRWVIGLCVAIVAAALVRSLVTNPNLQWSVIGHYIFNGTVLHGVVVTCYLTAIAIAIGFVGGTFLALMRLSGNPPLVAIAVAYTTIFRGIPQLVQMIFWGYLGAFYAHLSLTVPFTHWSLLSVETNRAVSATTAAILALGLNEIAYASEIIRGGILGVDRQQREAAYALGMKPFHTTRRIVLPQAMRTVIPPLGNEVISVLKVTSLVSVIAGKDLMTKVQLIYAQNYEIIPLLAVASLWYLSLTTLLIFPQRWLERRYGRGVNVIREHV